MTLYTRDDSLDARAGAHVLPERRPPLIAHIEPSLSDALATLAKAQEVLQTIRRPDEEMQDDEPEVARHVA